MWSGMIPTSSLVKEMEKEESLCSTSVSQKTLLIQGELVDRRGTRGRERAGVTGRKSITNTWHPSRLPSHTFQPIAVSKLSQTQPVDDVGSVGPVNCAS